MKVLAVTKSIFLPVFFFSLLMARNLAVPQTLSLLVQQLNVSKTSKVFAVKIIRYNKCTSNICKENN